ncbi:MAG: glycosyltransferase family 4 protein [Chloroflexi bacterium]|nr:glycosyltransferase family 4 protein [Chloroflexota bacterium]
MVRIGINAQKLFITQDYRNAGVSRYIERLARHLPQALPNAQFVLYTNEHLHHWPGVESDRVTIVSSTVPTTHPAVRILWEQAMLPLLAARDRLDLLHCPLNIRPVASTTPVVLTIHDLTFIHFPDRFHPAKQRYLATLTRYSARRTRRILSDSAATKRDVHLAFGVSESKIDVVYPGVDEDFRPYRQDDPADAAALDAFHTKYGLPRAVILYLGTLEPRKNVDRLVAAYAQLVAAGLPHHLVLAGGKGWYYQSIFAAVKAHNLQGRVHFPGYVSREEQPLWYNAAQLFVYPSLYEGFGLPPLEAMACGTPVVTSNTSSLPEVVGNAGVTVEPTDVDALAEVMRTVLTDESRAAEMSAAGRRQAARFSWTAAAQSCAAAYRAALPSVPLGTLAG